MRGPRRLLLITMTAGLVPLVAQTPPASAGAEPPPPPVRCQTVGIIGGSITVGSEKTQGQEFVDLGILNYRIDAKVGRQITRPKTGGIVTLAKMRASGYNPDCLVIALGTNDIPYYNTPSIYRNWINKMMDAIGPTPKVLWTNVYRGKSRSRDQIFNSQLADATNPATTDVGHYYPNLQIADWSTLVDSHKEWLSKDGVHPVGKGTRERSKWLALQVHEKLNGGGTPDGPPPATCTVSLTPLKRPAKGADVTCLEGRLRQLLWFTKKADTKFEYSTTSAVSAWQIRHGLPGTGIVDDATRAALGLELHP